MPKSQFQSGGPGGSGCPKGSRNRLAEAFLDALHADFLEHGVAAIEAARVESPLGHVRIVAGLLPQKLQVESGPGGMSDDQLVAIIRHAGDDQHPADCAEIEGAVH